MGSAHWVHWCEKWDLVWKKCFLRFYARLPREKQKGENVVGWCSRWKKARRRREGGTVHMSKPFHCWISNLVSGCQHWWRWRFIICIIKSWAPSTLIEKLKIVWAELYIGNVWCMCTCRSLLFLRLIWNSDIKSENEQPLGHYSCQRKIVGIVILSLWV